MSLITNENGTLKQLDASEYQSAHFIDDSLFQDLTLAELGYTEDMVAMLGSSEFVYEAAPTYLKPFKTYTFGFTPKMIRIMQYPGDVYMGKLISDSGIYADNPLQEYYCSTTSKTNLGFGRYLADAWYEVSTMFFQASSLGCGNKPGDTTNKNGKPIFIGGGYGACCVGSGVFCNFGGNASKYDTTDIITAFVNFGGKLQGNTFTLYTWVRPRDSRYTTADVLNSRWMYATSNGYYGHYKCPIFEFNVFGG